MPGPSNDDGHAMSAGGTEDTTDGGASDDENSQTYYFGASTIALSKIKETVEKGYFAEGEAQAPGTEVVLKPDSDEAIMYEDFFIAGLRLPPHPALGDILLHFQAQLHQVMPNAIAQLSKYFYAVGSFRGVPSNDAFVKQYELH
jgi:hypothetical protein